MRKIKLLFFFMCKAVGLFHFAKWLTRNHLKILCYHGFELADETEFRPKLFITSEKFKHRLTAIRRYDLCVLPLNEAIERLYSGSLPEDALVISVDDGFHSFYSVALPCLQQYGYPATVYVTTYYVENPHPIFRLVVQYMFWKTGKHEIVLRNVPWSKNQVIDLSDPEQTDQAIWDCIIYGERECTEEQRNEICKELGGLLETSYEEIVRSRIFHLMSPDELRSLTDVKVDVELHTHRHDFAMDNQSLAEQEITDNRAALKRWLSADASHFCYPSGLWDERQWIWLDSMHVKSSVTCIPGLNCRKTPRHALRRFLDGENIHQLEFEAALSGFSDLLRGFRIFSSGIHRCWATLHLGKGKRCNDAILMRHSLSLMKL